MPDAIGYVIEVVFKVNSDTPLGGKPYILNASGQGPNQYMSASFRVEPCKIPGKFKLTSSEDSYQYLKLDQWHKVQGVRVNPTGTKASMDYFIDGVYWRSSDVNIADGKYNNVITVGYSEYPSVGAITFDHLWIYRPFPRHFPRQVSGLAQCPSLTLEVF